MPWTDEHGKVHLSEADIQEGLRGTELEYLIPTGPPKPKLERPKPNEPPPDNLDIVVDLETGAEYLRDEGS